MISIFRADARADRRILRRTPERRGPGRRSLPRDKAKLFGSDPALRPLRNDPEFAALMSDLRRQEDDYRTDLELYRAAG